MIDVDGAALDDLRDRLRRTRWPERETVGDWSQGVPLGYLQDLCGYWASRYDWRATAAAAAGWDIHRIARAWAELMARLGYEQFLVAGSAWGTSVSTSLALHQPGQLLGIHLIPPLAHLPAETPRT